MPRVLRHLVSPRVLTRHSCAIISVSMVPNTSTMYAYLVNLSVTIQIESYSSPIIRSFESGKPTTKSKAINFYSRGSVSGDFISLYGV